MTKRMKEAMLKAFFVMVAAALILVYAAVVVEGIDNTFTIEGGYHAEKKDR
jgi:hypothetical protein